MTAITSDVELVPAAQTGDVAALGVLLESHRARLYVIALAILGDRAQAQDAVQDTFLIALRRLQELREPAAVGAWLQAIVRNVCRTRLRASREVVADIDPKITALRSDVDETIERLALRDWLWTALGELPADLRATVMLRYFTRHSAYAEIAAILGIPVGTVRSRLNQAKRRLADALLATAATAHRDQAVLVQQRWQWWSAVVAQVEREGSTALYLAGINPDVLVEAPSLGYRAVGAEDHARGMVETVAAGVRVRFTDIVAGDGITIVEGDYENPASDPHHCPATHTEVHVHPDGRATRIILYYSDGTDAEYHHPRG